MVSAAPREDKCYGEAIVHYVYEFYGENGEPLYIGCTKAFAKRMRTHELSSAWYEEAHYLVATEIRDRNKAFWFERDRIGLVKPKHNKMIANSRMPPVRLKKADKEKWWATREKPPEVLRKEKVQKRAAERRIERATKMAGLREAGATLHSIGTEYGVSRERVRQILAWLEIWQRSSERPEA